MNVWQKFKGWIAKKMNFTVETSPAMKEESFLEWLGVKRKNKDVMAEVTYFTCLKMMSETLAKIPWKYYQKTDKGIIELLCHLEYHIQTSLLILFHPR